MSVDRGLTSKIMISLICYDTISDKCLFADVLFYLAVTTTTTASTVSEYSLYSKQYFHLHLLSSDYFQYMHCGMERCHRSLPL